MNSNRLPRWIRGSLAAGLSALLMAGCGGGGGDSSTAPTPTPTPTPTPVAVASITLPADNGIAIVGAAKSIPTVVKGTDGSTLTNRTISWSSSNTAIATVGATGASGAVTPVAEGTAIVTATVEGKSATMTVYVRNAPADLAAYKAMLPFKAQSGNFIVASDISQAYSDARLDQLLKSWDFFKGFFPKQPGDWSEMYYTWDEAILANQGMAACPSAVPAYPVPLEGRKLVSCPDTSSNLSFLVAPNLDPTTGVVSVDNATVLATLSQAFMDSITTTQTYTFPWLWEGLSIAFRSGDFASGSYTMRALTDPERTTFKQAQTAGTLLTLPELVALTRARTTPPTGTWFAQQAIAEAQAAVLLNYLYRTYDPAILTDLFAEINKDPGSTVTTSQQAFDFVLNRIGKTADELDAGYKAYGAAL